MCMRYSPSMQCSFFWCSQQNLVCISLLPQTLKMPRKFHCPLICHLTNTSIWLGTQIMHFSLCCFSSLLSLPLLQVQLQFSLFHSRTLSACYLYCCTVLLVDSLIITQPTNALIICHLFLNHFFKTLSLLLHVSIAYRLSSSGSTYSSQLKSRVKI